MPEFLTAEEIRRIRGPMTQAAFARLLGVTPLTVYRWELPDGASEARRPRGRMVEAIKRAASLPAAALTSASSASFTPAHELDDLGIGPSEHDLLSPARAQLSQGKWSDAERTLLDLVSSGELRAPNARAVATTGLVEVQLRGRGDARAAFTALSPLLELADANELAPPIELRVRKLAALMYACPDGHLFDPGKVNAQISRAERLIPLYGAPAQRLELHLAEAHTAISMSDVQLLRRALERGEEAFAAATEPADLLAVDDVHSTAAFVLGNAALANRRFEALVEKASAAGDQVIVHRIISMLAARRLEDLADPAQILELIRRAHRAQSEGRTAVSLSAIGLARSEAEVLLRLGRLAEAEEAIERGLLNATSIGWPPTFLVIIRSYLYWLTGRSDELRSFASRLAGYGGRAQPALIRAYGALADATADAASAERIAHAAAGFERAQRMALEAGNWPFLVRASLVSGFGALAIAGGAVEARAALRRAETSLDRMPSPWATASLRCSEGVLLMREGRYVEAQQQLDSSLATFELAKDLPSATLVRHRSAELAVMRRDRDGEARLQSSKRELEKLGLAPVMVTEDRALPRPRGASGGSVPASLPAGARGEPLEARSSAVEQLAVSVAQLSTRGAGSALIQRELLRALERSFPEAAVRIESVDTSGTGRLLVERGAVVEDAVEAVELSDGAGGRLRVSVSGVKSGEASWIVSILCAVVGLALEVSALRGFGEGPASGREPDRRIEIPGFLAASPSMRRIQNELLRLSASRATVLVLGESGSGKEVVARALHDLSTRAGGPYVAFNCASVPRELFEGQLFGYRKGAYTGATADHAGVVGAANGGTLFLDEVAELPLEVQPKLLRFLENGEVLPLGETKPVRADVRLIAATHRDLAELVKQGRFREDLYYRLHVVPVRIPPLRERREDVVELARHFVRQLTPQGMEAPVLAADALDALVGRRWPGNVRELRNVIERAMAFAPLPKVLTREMLNAGE